MVYLWYTMDITTVKLHKGTKKALDKIRNSNESYNEIIAKLIDQVQNKDLRKQLVDGYTKDNVEVLNECESASSEI